ncbi:MAG: DUF3352 domain-containing protein [Acidimicrobiia bacterium]|nr:DUF3352 domain-containing protein [Acidimicrobiia bacterium]
MKRALASLSVLLVAAVLPACGNSGSKRAGGTQAAALVPSTALAYVSAAVDPSNAQKSNIDGILAKFPKASKKTFDSLKQDAVTKAVQRFGLNYQKDVQPWLGGELALAVLPDTPSPDIVGFIKSTDDAKAKAALDKAAASPQFKAAYRILSGYAVVIDRSKTALLDTIARQAGNPSTALSSQDKFTRVVNKLSSDRLVTAWADGHALVELAKVQFSRQAGRAHVDLASLPDLGSAALDLHTVTSGAVLNGIVETPGSTGGGDMAITDNLPSDTLGALSLWNLGGAFDSALGAALSSNPVAAQGLQKAQQTTGLDIRQDVLSWMHGETVLAVGPPSTGPTPDVALLVHATDPAQAQAAITKISSVLEQRLGIKLDQRPAPGGGTMYVFPAPIRTGIQPAMALLNDKFILASSTDYLTRLARGGGGFDGSTSFKDTLGNAAPGTQFQLVLQVSSIGQYVEGLLSGANKQRYTTDVKPWIDPFSVAAVRVRKAGQDTLFEIEATVK